jgi:hydroxypyruvate reductase
MIRPESFATHSLSHHPRGDAIARILASAIHAVEPGSALRRFVHREGNSLFIEQREYLLDEIGRVYILGLGKACAAMTQPLADLFSDRATRGLLIPKQTSVQPPSGFELQPGGHPVPDENSLLAGQKARALASNLSEDDLLICLISGGGSALMATPPPNISLADLRALTSALLACGARVDEINTLRRHLDQLKGGGLARLASPAKVVSLILSDVVGNPLEAIASGPTAPDPSTRADALAVLEKYGLPGKIPSAILRHLETGAETPKPGEALFERVQNVIVGSNALAAESAQSQARSEGFHPVLLGDDWQGEAREVAQKLCHHLKTSTTPRPFCLIAGGETTVTLHGRGRGGRNQELALASVRDIAGLRDVLLITLATDGDDGPTDAAGAVVTGETLHRGLELGLSPEAFLDDNDSYTYFSALTDLLKPGPTGTNVNDLMFCFGW